MDTFKYLKKEGSCYTVKMTGSVFIYFIIAVLGGLGIFGGSLFLTILMLLLVFLVIRNRNKKVTFDPENCIITFPGIRRSKLKVVSFSDFRGFKLVGVKQMPYGIVTNNWLQMEFEINGKIKALQVRQFGPGTRSAQVLVSEIEQVLEIGEVKVKIGRL